MKPAFEKLRTLVALGELLEPSAPDGAEHVMVEIAPGVFRSVNRKPRAPSRLLRELQEANALRENLNGHFMRIGQALRATQPKPEQANIPDARRNRNR